MRHKLIIDGNAVYEIDEECLRCREEQNTFRPDGRAAGKQDDEANCTKKKRESASQCHYE